MARVQLLNICKSYGSTEIIKDLNLEFGHGEFVVLVGPSGCGKSTLLRAISGLEKATAGKIVIDDVDMSMEGPPERGIAMVFQSYALYPHMTVAQNIGFGMRIAKRPKEEVVKRVREVATLLKLEELLDRKPAALSGGQRQRVAIGRALARDPKIFLFDEPLSNLDAALRAEMRVELSRLHATLGNTMIYVTHDQVEAMTLADRIVVMRDGRIEQVGAPLELFNLPANKFVAGFFGQPGMNFLKVSAVPSANGSVRLRAADVDFATLPAWSTDRSAASFEVGIRPEDIVVDGGPLKVSVEVVENLGDETIVYGRLADQQPLIVRIQGQRPLSRGDEVLCGPAPDKLHLFNAEGMRVAWN